VGLFAMKSRSSLAYALASDDPAARAGIRPGDVLTAVGNQKITSVGELLAALPGHEPGETVRRSTSAAVTPGPPGCR
jgi:serine protease DegQ